VESYGREGLVELFISAPFDSRTLEEYSELPPPLPDYSAVLGKSLEELETEWLDAIRSIN